MTTPQMKRLKVGDRVRIYANIAGTIKAVTDNAVLIGWDDGVEDGWIDKRDGKNIERLEAVA